jgi:carotenoid cleavage oxygenase
VVIDLVRYERMFDGPQVSGPDDAPPLLHRFVIDTVSGTVSATQLSDVPMEFPRVDERLVGRPHRWGYATGMNWVDGAVCPGNLLRIDASSGDVRSIDLGPGRTSGEWVMVPRDGSAAEDDGWLMSLVHDAATDRSELLVLSAGDPGDGPVARVLLPTRVPIGFHGNWVPDLA